MLKLIELDGQKLSRSRKVKCLGVWLDDELTWKDHVSAVRRRCLGGLAKLRRLKNELPPGIKKKIYNVLVLPHLGYCSILWQECSGALHDQKNIERIRM